MMEVGNEMIKEELITITIEKCMDLQRIKKANGDVANANLITRLKVQLRNCLLWVYP